jgi:ribonuclease HI
MERAEWLEDKISIAGQAPHRSRRRFVWNWYDGKDLLSNLSRTNHQRAEIVTDSRLALTELQSTRNWVLPIVKDIKRKAKQVEEEGGRVVLTWLSSGSNCEGYDVANAAAQRAARQQPKAMRSASLSFMKHAVKEKWKPTTRPNKHI